MNGHTILWSSPSPLWGRFRNTAGDASFGVPDQARPAILRFATDEFMEQLLSTLASEPRQLGALVARPETWRSPAGDAPTLIERTPTPTIARGLARLRKNQQSLAALEPTVAEQDLDEAHIARAVKPKLPLKLYAPSHQRYYLVAANLVCAQTGFPDRALATNGHDQVGFVLRRMLKPKTAPDGPTVKFAFVKDDSGILWRQVRQDASEGDPAARLEDGEELLPLFPINFRDDVDHPRRLLTGMIPVGRREEYMCSRAVHLTVDGTPESTGGAGTTVSARKEQFKLEVSEPWKNVVRTAYRRAQTINEDPDASVNNLEAKRQNAIKELNDQLQGQSWLLLLDLADYLSLHVPRVWKWVIDASDKPSPLEPGEQRLVDWLNTSSTLSGTSLPISRGTPQRPFATNLRNALKLIRANESIRAGLEGVTRLYPFETPNQTTWPDFLFLLAGMRDTKEAAGIHSTLTSVAGVGAIDSGDIQATPPLTDDDFSKVEAEAATLDKLVQLVIGAFHPAHAAAAPPVPFAVQLRDALKTTNGDPGWFVLRCVYLRPNCGALHPAVLSARSQQFQLASFFDPDAPARPIRIALPIDTTAAGLRKFSKNTAFMISDTLCGQLNSIKGISFGDLVLSVLPWPFYKPLDVGKDGIGPCVGGSGMICTLSIPYITIIALILMFMIALVLNLIFFWIPWFICCFPLPGFKAKK